MYKQVLTVRVSLSNRRRTVRWYLVSSSTLFSFVSFHKIPSNGCTRQASFSAVVMHAFHKVSSTWCNVTARTGGCWSVDTELNEGCRPQTTLFTFAIWFGGEEDGMDVDRSLSTTKSLSSPCNFVAEICWGSCHDRTRQIYLAISAWGPVIY